MHDETPIAVRTQRRDRAIVARCCTIALALVFAAAGGLVWYAGDMLTRAAPAPTGAPDPALDARAVTFASAAGGKLSAWFITGESGAGAVVLLHGIRANKRAMLPRARFLRQLGFSLLLVDLQAHGESDGERIGFGHREAAGVDAAVRTLQALAPCERLGVLGTSLGAAALVFSDAESLLAASVLEALYPRIDRAVENRLRLRFGWVGPWLTPLLLAQLEPRLGVRVETLRPIERVSRLRHPVLLVHGDADRHTPLAEARAILAAIQAPKELFVVPGARHGDLHALGGADYEHRVGRFLERHLRQAHEPPRHRGSGLASCI